TQSVTLAVRALALGEIEFKDLLRIILKEILTGIGMGIVLGTVGGIVGFIITHSLKVANIVFFALLVVIIFSNLLGIFLPMIFKKLKIDPAVSSSPLITTLIDICGLFIYFSIAYLFLFI
ncbi:MAG: magnesium transporter, partial [candidate division WOR-3 bacterium]